MREANETGVFGDANFTGDSGGDDARAGDGSG